MKKSPNIPPKFMKKVEGSKADKTTDKALAMKMMKKRGKK